MITEAVICLLIVIGVVLALGSFVFEDPALSAMGTVFAVVGLLLMGVTEVQRQIHKSDVAEHDLAELRDHTAALKKLADWSYDCVKNPGRKIEVSKVERAHRQVYLHRCVQISTNHVVSTLPSLIK